MICEMFSYYATKGISLLDKLDELYKTYGYCLNTLHSYEFDGSAGFAKMQSIMQAFRGDIKAFGGKKVVKLLDYAPGLDGLPKSDVLKFLLEDNCSIVVRPSGTEPKIRVMVEGQDLEAIDLCAELVGTTNPNVVSDLGIAALTLKTAMQSAWLNVLINLSSLKDKAFRDECCQKGEALLAHAVPIAQESYEKVLKVITEK